MASNPKLPDNGRGKQCQLLPIDPQDGARTTNQLHTQRAGHTIVLNQYERLKRIGAGQHGEVYVAWNRHTESLVVSTLGSSQHVLSVTFIMIFIGNQGNETEDSPRQDEVPEEECHPRIPPYASDRSNGNHREQDSERNCYHEEVPTRSCRPIARSHRRPYEAQNLHG